MALSELVKRINPGLDARLKALPSPDEVSGIKRTRIYVQGVCEHYSIPFNSSANLVEFSREVESRIAAAQD